MRKIIEAVQQIDEADKRTTYYEFDLSDDKTELRMTDLNGNYTLLNKDEFEELYKALGTFKGKIKG